VWSLLGISRGQNGGAGTIKTIGGLWIFFGTVGKSLFTLFASLTFAYHYLMMLMKEKL